MFSRQLISAFVLVSWGTIASAGVPLAMPLQRSDPVTFSIDELKATANALNAKIGSYPPKLSSDGDRQATYAKWADALQKAWAVTRNAPDSESSLSLLSELYRQGHNLDVVDTDHRADTTIQKCLSMYPKSIACNFSAAYFYLSIDPKYAPYGEKSLLRLRELRKPEVDQNVEKGLAFAYLYEGRVEDAKKQIDYYLTLDPKSDWAVKFKDGLERGKLKVKHIQ